MHPLPSPQHGSLLDVPGQILTLLWPSGDLRPLMGYYRKMFFGLTQIVQKPKAESLWMYSG